MLLSLGEGVVYVAFLRLFQTHPHFGELSKSKPSKLYGDEAESRCKPCVEMPSQSQRISVSPLMDGSQKAEGYQSAP